MCKETRLTIGDAHRSYVAIAPCQTALKKTEGVAFPEDSLWLL